MRISPINYIKLLIVFIALGFIYLVDAIVEYNGFK